MRQRVEDLGRLLELLQECVSSDLFETKYRRSKDACDWFRTLTIEAQNDFIHTTAYDLERLNFQLSAMIEIAKGEDYLNRNEEG